MSSCVEIADVYEIMGNLMSIPYDFDRNITEQDVSESMDKIRELPSVQPKTDTLDKIRTEIEETYMNITYQDNKDRKATWGLRKALEIIDKYRAEME